MSATQNTESNWSGAVRLASCTLAVTETCTAFMTFDAAIQNAVLLH
jgi:hypothetical protein